MGTNKNNMLEKTKIILNEWLKIFVIGFAIQAIPYLTSDFLFNNGLVISIKWKIFRISFSWLLVSAIWYMVVDYIKHVIETELKDSFWWTLFLFGIILISFLLLLTDAIYNAII